MQFEDFKKKYRYEGATQVMKQYLNIKFQNIECLILFRMGDFYELFYEDAITAARILGIALTKRGKTGEEEIAMCGVPHHALENYLNKLLEDGFKVAICDQLETPEEAKKRGGYKAVVNRNVTRIITPGTIIEESLLEVNNPSYLVSITSNKNKSSIAYIDLSTSDLSVISLPEEQIINELARLRPKEILLAEQYRSSNLASQINSGFDLRISFQVNSFFSLNKCRKNILSAYQIQDVKSIGELTELDIIAVGSLIEYITVTQKEYTPKLLKPKLLYYDKFMAIDASTRLNLEIFCTSSRQARDSLFDTINETVTKGGSRLLYKYLSAPLITLEKINERLALTKYFHEKRALCKDLRNLLEKTADLERCLTRLNMGKATPKDLLSIKDTIKIAENIKAIFVATEGVVLPLNIEKLIQPLSGLEEIFELIDNVIREEALNVINDGGIIKPSYHPRINELTTLINHSKSAINQLRDHYRQITKIENLKISNNNVLGLFIDITTKQASKINDEQFIHRQSTISSVRYTTKELQELESKIINARSIVINLEYEIYQHLCKKIGENQLVLHKTSQALNLLDLFTNFAYIAHEYNYTLPKISNDIIFEIKNGRHPVIEKLLKKQQENFVANDINLEFDQRLWLITGPNMAGKSTYLRQNAIIAILAHIGSFVPADSAHIGVIDKIFSRIGAGDDLNKGHSTFMLEMLETSAILAQASHHSLIILDEVGRGTSTYDGVSIAWSVLEYIHDKIRARCLFATHYHELTEMETTLPALKNYTISINDTNDEIIFLHKIQKGSADRSYGIHVAQMAGLPKSVIKKATKLLNSFERNTNNDSKKLRQYQAANLTLFEHDEQAELKTKQDSAKILKYQQLYQKFTEIKPDQLSPKEALDILYQLKEKIK